MRSHVGTQSIKLFPFTGENSWCRLGEISDSHLPLCGSLYMLRCSKAGAALFFDEPADKRLRLIDLAREFSVSDAACPQVCPEVHCGNIDHLATKRQPRNVATFDTKGGSGVGHDEVMGPYLTLWRKHFGYSLERMAELMGYENPLNAKSTLSKAEGRRNVGSNWVERYAKIFGMKAEDLYQKPPATKNVKTKLGILVNTPPAQGVGVEPSVEEGLRLAYQREGWKAMQPDHKLMIAALVALYPWEQLAREVLAAFDRKRLAETQANPS